MEAYLQGIVNTLNFNPNKQALMPIFEAISNSLESLEQSKTQNPIIKVTIDRLEGQQILPQTDSSKQSRHIQNVIIEDNGMGFTEENYNAFKQIAYTNKVGHKGIGRIFWLKTFEKVEVESAYHQNKTLLFRNFEFSIQNEFKDVPPALSTHLIKPYSKITLAGLKPAYRKQLTKRFSVIKNEVMAYFLLHLLKLKELKIEISDGTKSEIITYRDLPPWDEQEIKIGNYTFKVYHFKCETDYTGKKHHYAYCASNRVVFTQKVNDLTKEIDFQGNKFWYQCYIMSEFLDDSVNQERTGFNIADDYGELLEDSDELIPWSLIQAKIIACSQEYMLKYKKVFDEMKKIKVENLNRSMPQYDYLFKDADFLDSFQHDWSEDQIAACARKEHGKREVEVQEDIQKAVKFLESFSSDEELVEHQKEFEDLYTKVTDVNSANLKNYILQRKYIIDLLNKLLEKQTTTDSYAYEKQIHKIIYPMTTDSKSVLYDQHNLWVIDEKLSFHHYLASDISLKSYSCNLAVNSLTEPDIAIFKDNLVLSEDNDATHKSVVIIEFKRPERTNYAKDPIEQVIEYVESIREGDIKDDKGRTIRVSKDSVRFYCYLICSINEAVLKKSSRYNFKANPDQDRYFTYIADYNCYFEIIDYTTLLKDCEKRNQVLFHKLGI